MRHADCSMGKDLDGGHTSESPGKAVNMSWTLWFIVDLQKVKRATTQYNGG